MRCSTTHAFGRGAVSRPPSNTRPLMLDRKSTRLNSSHLVISYAVFCLKKKNQTDGTFPYCTLLINLSRCFMIGLIGQLILNRMLTPAIWSFDNASRFLVGYTSLSYIS